MQLSSPLYKYNLNNYFCFHPGETSYSCHTALMLFNYVFFFIPMYIAVFIFRRHERKESRRICACALLLRRKQNRKLLTVIPLASVMMTHISSRQLLPEVSSKGPYRGSYARTLVCEHVVYMSAGLCDVPLFLPLGVKAKAVCRPEKEAHLDS